MYLLQAWSVGEEQVTVTSTLNESKQEADNKTTLIFKEHAMPLMSCFVK